MPKARRQPRYDYRLRELVQRTGDVSIATDVGVPRSTARGWLRTGPATVVSLDVTDVTALELRHEVLTLRRRVHKLAALLQLALTLLRVSGVTLQGARLPDGPAKRQLLRAIDQATTCIPLRALLRVLRLSPSRFHAWRRRDMVGAFEGQPSCPRTSPHRVTTAQIQVIADMITSANDRHVPTGTLAVLAQRLGIVWASAFDVVPARAPIRVAPSSAPQASRQAQGGPPDHAPR